ncbi:unnamed protein product [Sphenostylis stenocarpa]|uniref:Uncharacterized protein n=1 Tax=Sphenostylis stenocarpa TaxID=92480 RepID=A0AA86S2D9_9FABA|nr:unnamed protein product [Sphenostylis stenocarpa]
MAVGVFPSAATYKGHDMIDSYEHHLSVGNTYARKGVCERGTDEVMDVDLLMEIKQQPIWNANQRKTYTVPIQNNGQQ